MYIILVILSLLFLPFLEFFLYYIGFGSVFFALVLYIYNNDFFDMVVLLLSVLISLILDVSFQINLGSYLFVISTGLIIFWIGEQFMHLNLWWQKLLLYLISLYLMNLFLNYFVYLGDWDFSDLTDITAFPWRDSLLTVLFNFLSLLVIYLIHRLIIGDLGKDSKLTV